MAYSTERIIELLKAARAVKQLTQRELSAKIGVPQSHISKIEKGVVDLKLSSLIELTRALDLELMLVPRTLVPAVKGLIRSAGPGVSGAANPLASAPELLQLFRELEFAESAHPTLPQVSVFASMKGTLKELQLFRLGRKDLAQVRMAIKELQRFRSLMSKLPNDTLLGPKELEPLRRANALVRDLRNSYVHGKPIVQTASPEPTPAYRLNEGGDDA